MSERLCIDLCSGLGGFSRAFVDAGWEVITVDVLSKFKPTIVADVRYLPFRENLAPDILLMSPPCNHFSTASLIMKWPRKGIKQALEVVGACLEAVPFLKPKSWVMENPRGMLRRVIGKPLTTVYYQDYGDEHPKPTDLWGDFKLGLAPNHSDRRLKGRPARTKIYTDGRTRPGSFTHGWAHEVVRDSARRAIVPIGLSKAILEAVESK